MGIQYAGEVEYPDGYTGDHILDFDNFSPNEMDRILYHPFEDDCPFHLGQDLCDLDDVPLLNHVMIYLEYLKENSPLKLTPKGNFTRSVCKYLIENGVRENDYYLDQPIRSEDDIQYLGFMKQITSRMGLVSKRNNKFSLSGKGKKFLKMDVAERYRVLFKYMATGFNWGYFDFFPESWIVQGGFAFSIFLFQKYGEEKRPPEFYSHRFRIAFPDLYLDFVEWRGRDPVMGYEWTYITRVIKRFLCRMGLVEVEYEDETGYDILSVRKKPLMDRVIVWDRDVFDFDREGYIRKKEEERKKRVEMERKRKLRSKYGRKVLSRIGDGKSNLYTLTVYLIQGPLPEGFEELVSRTIQIRGDQTLEDLHHAIFKAFDRWEEHMYEFLLGEGPFDRSAVYSLPFWTDPEVEDSLGSVKDTTIDSLGLEEGRAFGYRFDFGDEWLHQIDVVGIDENESSEKYPRIIDRTGKSPPQYPDID
jgi:hypothetical protein